MKPLIDKVLEKSTAWKALHLPNVHVVHERIHVSVYWRLQIEFLSLHPPLTNQVRRAVFLGDAS